jgi:hypothetical protein
VFPLSHERLGLSKMVVSEEPAKPKRLTLQMKADKKGAAVATVTLLLANRERGAITASATAASIVGPLPSAQSEATLAPEPAPELPSSETQARPLQAFVQKSASGESLPAAGAQPEPQSAPEEALQQGGGAGGTLKVSVLRCEVANSELLPPSVLVEAGVTSACGRTKPLRKRATLTRARPPAGRGSELHRTSLVESTAADGKTVWSFERSAGRANQLLLPVASLNETLRLTVADANGVMWGQKGERATSPPSALSGALCVADLSLSHSRLGLAEGHSRTLQLPLNPREAGNLFVRLAYYAAGGADPAISRTASRSFVPGTTAAPAPAPAPVPAAAPAADLAPSPAQVPVAAAAPVGVAEPRENSVSEVRRAAAEAESKLLDGAAVQKALDDKKKSAELVRSNTLKRALAEAAAADKKVTSPSSAKEVCSARTRVRSSERLTASPPRAAAPRGNLAEVRSS